METFPKNWPAVGPAPTMPVTAPDATTPVLRPCANTPVIPFAKTAEAKKPSWLLVALMAVPVFTTERLPPAVALPICTLSPPSKATTPPPDRRKSVPPPTSPMREPNNDTVDGASG